MQKIDDLGQRLLRLILPGHVGKRGLHVRLGIDPGAAAAEREEVAAALHAGLHAPADLPPDKVEGQTGQHPHQHEIEHGGVLAGHAPVEGDPSVGIGALGLQQTVDQLGIADLTGLKGLRLVVLALGAEIDQAVLDHDPFDQPAVHLADKGSVVGLDDPAARKVREDQPVEEQDDQHDPQQACIGIASGRRRSSVVLLLHNCHLFRAKIAIFHYSPLTGLSPKMCKDSPKRHHGETAHSPGIPQAGTRTDYRNSNSAVFTFFESGPHITLKTPGSTT